MKQLLVIGSQGQMARAIRLLRPDAVFLDRTVIDLSHPEGIVAKLALYDAEAIINTAAYTQVDNAEKEEALALTVNAESPRVMAVYCAEKKIPFITFSSDYVFDGQGNAPWTDDAPSSPLNAYGRTKAIMEKEVAAAGGKYLIFRTSWIYDGEGKNFLNTILRLAGEREELRIINDQFGAPTYARHLAKAVLFALETAMAKPQFPSGIYNLCNAGVTTWYGFANRIVELARAQSLPVKVKNIYPIPATEYPLPAKRPYNSRLDCSKAKAVLNVSMPDWENSLRDCMSTKSST